MPDMAVSLPVQATGNKPKLLDQGSGRDSAQTF
jgi:hypothetical protein